MNASWMKSSLAVLIAVLVALPVRADDLPKKAAWNLDEVLEQLGHHPKDQYLHYVALMLSARENREREVDSLIDRLVRPNGMEDRGGRRSRVDLFSTFTGALAIQESLQLDTMRGPGRRPQPAAPAPKGVIPEPAAKKGELPKSFPVAKLIGPAAPSHPWDKMLGNKKPEVGPLALCVPDDFWFAEFNSLAKLNEVAGLSELFAGHLFAQALGEARSPLTLERIRKQLGLSQLPPKALEAIQLDGIALTGSDLFLGEGSDVTVLAQGKGVAGLVALAIPALRLRAKEEKGEFNGIAYSHYATTDGTLNVFLATPRPNLHIRGNSLPAFLRVLDCVQGKQTKRLGESKEFQYVRTLLPYRAAEEDGFVYLSDAFIHRLVDPQLKITERRRLLVYNHLRMIGHGCLMFRTENGRAPKSLGELAETKCAPGIFGKGDLAHPDGGNYSLAADGMSGLCSKWGRADSLTPCIEHLILEATKEESDEYREFVSEYNQYWRTYFDPIAVRVQVSSKQYRLETLILPLIDNSIYTTMAQLLGGPTVTLDTLPTPKREIGGVWFHLNKKPLLEILGPEQNATAKKEPEKSRPGKPLKQAENDLKQLGLAMHNYVSVNDHLPVNVRDKEGKLLLSWRVLLLPYLEQDNLFRAFKLDEPWDSEHNKKLVAKMPKVFQGPTNKLSEDGKTIYLAPSGKETLFPPDAKPLQFSDVADGLSNTIAFVEAADDAAVIWSKPGDLPIDLTKPWRNLQRPGQDVAMVGMVDGSVRRISHKLDQAALAAALTRAGGETVMLYPKSTPEPARPKTANDFVNDLRQLGLAMHSFNDVNGHLPPPPRLDKDGKQIKSELSWRVHLLPYIEHDNLYREFKLNEPWDSEHNKKLIARMPRIYQGLSKKLNDEGKTIFVVPAGKGTMFPSDGSQLSIASVSARDGASNTIMAGLADDEHNVIWTKPDDLAIDWKQPLKGFRTAPDGWLVLMGDGNVKRFTGNLDAKKAAALLTVAGDETVAFDPGDEISNPSGAQGPLFDLRLTDRDREELEKLGIDLNKVRRFIRDGIGDQIGLHMHDASKLFDYEIRGALGGGPQVLGGRLGSAEAFGLGLLVQFVTGPSSISIPVKDAKVVDEFLDELDRLLIKMRAMDNPDLGWLREISEFYKLPVENGPATRCLAIKAFGLVYRIHWARIGSGLYIVNRPFVLEDIRAAQSGGKKPEGKDIGHALVRLRPENWKEVLTGYNLGWAEKHRSGCHDNLSLLTNTARGWNDKAVDAALLERVVRFYGVRPRCPDGGTYTLSADGKRCTCTIHGNELDPRQPVAPSSESPTGKFLKALAGLRATLTFHEEGLRAVVVIERRE